MEENIFNGAYFGKPYRTKDGRNAFFNSVSPFGDTFLLTIEGEWISIEVFSDGRTYYRGINSISDGIRGTDIIPIDDDFPIGDSQLTEFAHNLIHSMSSHVKMSDAIPDYDNKVELVKKAYKLGWRKIQ